MSRERFLLPVALFVATGLAAQQEPASAARRALLIGINDYRANDGIEKPEFFDLAGCRNDVALMRGLLERSGFGDIRVLEDSQASRQGILDAFAALERDVGKGDTVFFHFSGHGAQAEDFDDETVDSLDETLMPYDARMPGVKDIVDDEIGAWLDRLRAKGAAHLVVVLDCCHSGSGTRGLGLVARGAPPDPRTELYESGTRGLVDLRSGAWVVVTGAAADQQALDGPIDGRSQGALTWALVRSLEAEPGATPVRLWQLVEAQLAELAARWPPGTVMPDPQIEVPQSMHELSLLPAVAQPTAGFAAAVSFGEDGAPYLDSSAGARGALWLLFAPNAPSLGREHALATAEVADVVGDRAVLRVVDARGPLPAGCRALPVAPPVARDLPVHFDCTDAPDSAALLERVAALVPGLRAVGAQDVAALRVRVGARCEVRSPDGESVLAAFPVARERAATDVAQVIRRSARAASLLALANPSAQLELRVRAVKREQPRAETTTRGVTVRTRNEVPTYRPWREGAAFSVDNCLQLEIEASEDCYVTVVDVDAEGAINVLFPVEGADPGFLPDGRIPGRTKVLVPDSLAADNAAGILWPIAPPAGLDSIRVFAATDRETARVIRAGIAAVGSGDDAAAWDGLRRDLAFRGVRFVRAVDGGAGSAAGDWTAASLTIRIVE
jgi:hypothetical protein